MATDVSRFHVADFVVFGVTILISIGIGVYHALSGGKQKTTSEYLLGGRLINFVPVAISLMVTFESSIMMLGLPAEGYFHGIQYIMSNVGGTIAHLMPVFITVPLIHPLKITTSFEYLELRYKSKKVRLLGTVFGMFFYVWYMGIVLFGPATALEAVTGFPQWTSILVIALVSVIYTSIGGLKAVVWTDVFQAVIMFCGIFAVLIKGTMEVGGPRQVWEIANQGGRLNFFDFDPDPMVRMTFWGLSIGTFFRFLGYCFNQSTIQRISSTSCQKDARRVIWLATPIFIVVSVLGLYEGIVAYAYYQTKQCDPYQSKQITNQNQVLPLMVMEIFKDTPGMPGLFLASLFSASLSTLSSGLSSLSAVFWTDIAHPLIGDISDFKGALIAKLSVLVFGTIACGLAFLVALIGGIIHQIASIILVTFSAPTAGIFLLGVFFPRVNAKGAMIGSITSYILTSWISFGMNFSPSVRPSPLLPPASTAQCPVDDILTTTTTHHHMYGHSDVYTNVTIGVMNSTMMIPGISQPTELPPLHGVEILYNLSYNWLSVISMATTLSVGYVASLLTGANKPGDVDPRFIIDLSKAFFCCPTRFQTWLSSFGTQFIKEEYKEKFPDPALTENLLDQEVIVLPETNLDLSYFDRGDDRGNDHASEDTTTNDKQEVIVLPETNLDYSYFDRGDDRVGDAHASEDTTTNDKQIDV